MCSKTPNVTLSPTGPGVPTADVELVVRVGRWTCGGRLRHTLGDELYRTLTVAQRDRLAVVLEILDTWQAYRRLVRPRHGQVGVARAAFCAAAERVWTRKIAPGRVQGWLHLLATCGVAGLIDRRGRPPGNVPVDAELVLSFLQLLSSGKPVAQAHRAVEQDARREGRRWMSLSSIRTRLAVSETVVERTRPSREPKPRAYLARGQSEN